jgi:hypothetical protein
MLINEVSVYVLLKQRGILLQCISHEMVNCSILSLKAAAGSKLQADCQIYMWPSPLQYVRGIPAMCLSIIARL